jgi:hypothetical protein
MTEKITDSSAAAFVPKIWSGAIVDYLERGAALDRAMLDGRPCQWHEDWTSVYTPDGERFAAAVASVYLDDDGTAKLLGIKTAKRWVPDVAAQSDLQTLLDKWRAEGKDAMAESFLNYGSACGCCGENDNCFDALTIQVTEIVERVAPVEACTFYQAVPMGMTINIPKYESIRIEAATGGDT